MAYAGRGRPRARSSRAAPGRRARAGAAAAARRRAARFAERDKALATLRRARRRSPPARRARRAAAAPPSGRGRDRPPARGRPGSGGRARPGPPRGRPAAAARASRRPARRRAACRRPGRGRRSRAGRSSISRWTSAWPSVGTPAESSRARSCETIERALLGERPLDRLDAAVGLRRRDPLLGEPAGVAGEQRRRRQRLQPGVVLAADQVQGAAVEPGDQQRALLAQRPVDVGRGEALGAGANREPRSARVLPLHGEQPLGDGDGIGQRRAGQSLRRQSLGEAQPTSSRSMTKISVSFGPIAGGDPSGP